MTPTNAIDHDQYMSDFYNDADVTNMRANYQKLLYFVYKVAMKYKHGRRMYKKTENGYNALNLVDKEEVQPHRELNAQLFVNALLWYVFEESGMGRSMLDKRGRQYPSNCINKMFDESWGRDMQPKKVTAFKQLHRICSDILEQDDARLTKGMELIGLRRYISTCKAQGVPAYDEDDNIFCMKNKNVIINILTGLVRGILFPNLGLGHPTTLYEKIRKLPAEMEAAKFKDHTIPDTVDKTVPKKEEPAPKPVKKDKPKPKLKIDPEKTFKKSAEVQEAKPVVEEKLPEKTTEPELDPMSWETLQNWYKDRSAYRILLRSMIEELEAQAAAIRSKLAPLYAQEQAFEAVCYVLNSNGKSY